MIHYEEIIVYFDPWKVKCLAIFILYLSSLKAVKAQQRIPSTVPSKIGKDTKSSGSHFGWHLKFWLFSKQQQQQQQKQEESKEKKQR